MFFCACLGHPKQVQPWLRMLDRHAVWLGLTSHISERPVADGRVFAFGWLSREPPDTSALVRETHDRLTLATLPTLSMPDEAVSMRQGFETDVIQIQVSLSTGELLAAVPVLTAEKLFYVSDSNGFVLSTDLRLLLRWAGLVLDERGVYALFRHATMPFTLTLSKRVRQVPFGHRLRLAPGAPEPTLEPYFRWPEEPRSPLGDAENRFRETLDGVLARVPPSPLLFFSGHIDSGLIAARLRALGRNDVTLANFAFGPDDPEGQFAPKVADHLGLPFEQIMWRSEDAPDALGRLALEFDYPFGDPATLPTLLMVEAASRLSAASRVTLDGSGSEILFPSITHYQKWSRVYSIPRPLRVVLGQAFRWWFWREESRRARIAAAIHQSTRAPLRRTDYYGEFTVEGVAYDLPRGTRRELEAIEAQTYDVLLRELGPLPRASLSRILGLGSTVARSLDPLRRRGLQPYFPFLQPEIAQLSARLHPGEVAVDGGSKGLERLLLSRSVPREYVFRPRTGFVLPFHTVFADLGIRAFVYDVALSSSNPLLDFCRVRVVREIVQRLERGLPVTRGGRRFLWTLVFTSAWLNQLEK